MPSIISAAALLVTSANPGLDKGLWLGGALSLGFLIGVALQYLILRLARFELKRAAPRYEEFREDAGGAITLLWATLPGQLYYRYQLQIANIMLDPSMTAAYLYIKQIFVAAAQFIGFLRRVEFPDMIRTLLKRPPHIIRVVLHAQKVSTIVSVFVAGSLSIFGLAVYVFRSGEFADIGRTIAIFSPFLFVNALALAFVQGLGAAGRFRSIANALLASTIIAAALSPVLVYVAGLYGLFAADLVLECVSLLFLLAALHKTTGRSA
jgi:O-antigen/teichoic acid export membrane protein